MTKEKAIEVIVKDTGASEEEALNYLIKCDGNINKAIAMILNNKEIDCYFDDSKDVVIKKAKDNDGKHELKVGVTYFKMALRIAGWSLLIYAFIIFSLYGLSQIHVLPGGKIISWIEKFSILFKNIYENGSTNVYQLTSLISFVLGTFLIILSVSKNMALRIIYLVFWLLGILSFITTMSAVGYGGLELFKINLKGIADKTNFDFLKNILFDNYLILRLIFAAFLMSFVHCLKSKKGITSIVFNIGVSIFLLGGLIYLLAPQGRKDIIVQIVKYVSDWFIYIGCAFGALASVFGIIGFIRK